MRVQILLQEYTLFENKLFDLIQIGMNYVTVFIRSNFLVSCPVKIKLISPIFFALLFVTQFCNSERVGIDFN